ncbi:MAG: hypothetical protein ACYSU5_23725, partial [Planctomycetota bacterium]
WAIEQTVEALEGIRTLVICGTDYWGTTSIPFKFWIRFSEDNNGLFDMRFESEKQIIVVRGTKAWAYWHDENAAKVYEDVTTSDDMMRDLRFWSKIGQNKQDKTVSLLIVVISHYLLPSGLYATLKASL